MIKKLPNFSKKIHINIISNLFEKKYSEIMPVWSSLQLEWMNSVYKTFHDYEKFMIVIYLMQRTFNFNSKDFVKLTYNDFFNQRFIEIKKFNITEISTALNIPKESTRRKINELEKIGIINRLQKKIILNQHSWTVLNLEEIIKIMSRFSTIFLNILYNEKIISNQFTNENIKITVKENFFDVWKLYFDMQIQFLLNFKAIFKNLEIFHVNAVCITNQFLNSKQQDNSKMSKAYFLDKYFFTKQIIISGINAKSISDITGIPRATVTRKLEKLVKEKYLKIDKKKHYTVSGFHKKKMILTQKKNFNNISIFIAHVCNLMIFKETNKKDEKHLFNLKS